MVASMRWLAAAACVLGGAYSEEVCGAVSEEQVLQQEVHDVHLLQLQASVDGSATKHVATDPQDPQAAAVQKDEPMVPDIGDGGPERHPEALGALQAADQSTLERSILGARKFLHSLVEGNQSVASHKVVAALQSALSLKFNATTREIEAFLRSFDKDADGMLAPAELRNLVHPEIEEEEAPPSSDGQVLEQVQEAVQFVSSSSSWRDYYGSIRYYHGSGPDPAYLYFRPRVFLEGDLSVSQCAFACTMYPSDPYFYSNAATTGGTGMCRCLPKDTKADTGYNGRWYTSNSQNIIFYNPS